MYLGAAFMKQWEDFVHLLPASGGEGENLAILHLQLLRFILQGQFSLGFIHLTPATSLLLQTCALFSGKERKIWLAAKLRHTGHFLSPLIAIKCN